MKVFSKRFVLLLSAILITGLCLFLSIRQYRVKAFQTGVIPGSLHALAQTTLNEGKNSADVPLMLFEYGPAEGLSQALSNYSVVVAYPVSSNSSIWDDEHQIIGTWYRFVITETLSLKPFPTCDTCQPSPNPPSGMTAGANELLIPKFGGSVWLNGVTLTSADPNFPNYQASQPYLLFLDVDTSKRVGVLGGGPIAAFSVSSTGTLSPVTQMRSALAEEIFQTYGNSLSAFRTSLNGSPPPGPTPCTASSRVIAMCTNNGGAWDTATCRCN